MLKLMYRGDYVVHVDEIQYLDKPEHMRPFAIKSEPEVSEEEEEAERDPGSYYDSTTHRTRNLRAIFHAQMYSVGDYFQILRLQSWAFEEFYREFTPVAFACYSEGQKAFCMAVSEVYNSTPPSNPGLRRVVVKKTVEKLCCQGRAENPILNRETLRRVTEFAIDVCVEALDWLNTADE